MAKTLLALDQPDIEDSAAAERFALPAFDEISGAASKTSSPPQKQVQTSSTKPADTTDNEPKKWADVVNSDAFSALTPQQKVAARDQYFAQVVAPRVPQGKLAAAKAQFQKSTSIFNDEDAAKYTDAAIGPKDWYVDAAKNYRDDSEQRSASEIGKDALGKLASGAVAFPQSAAGLADLAMTPNRKALDALTGEKHRTITQMLADNGVDFQQARNFLSTDLRSLGGKNQDQAVQRAFDNGVIDGLKSLKDNPGHVVESGIESLPGMLSIAGGARIVASKIFTSAAAEAQAAGLTGDAVTAFAQKAVEASIPRLAKLSAVLEGAQSAGDQASGYAAQGTLDTKQAAASVGAGISTAILGQISNKLGAKFGLEDAEAAIAASGYRGKITGDLINKVIEIAKTSGKEFIKEGVLEELPQSMGEQAFQNIGDGKPVGQGVAQAGIEGGLVGGVMGAAGGGAATLRNIAPSRNAENLEADRVAPANSPALPAPAPFTVNAEGVVDTGAAPVSEPTQVDPDVVARQHPAYPNETPAAVPALPPPAAIPVTAEGQAILPGQQEEFAAQQQQQQAEQVAAQHPGYARETPAPEQPSAIDAMEPLDMSQRYAAPAPRPDINSLQPIDSQGREVDAAPPAGPLGRALKAGADALPAAAIATEAAPVARQQIQEPAPAGNPVEQPATNASAPEALPEQPLNLSDLSEQELRARMKFIASEAKQLGNNKSLRDERKKVEAEINRRTATQVESKNASNKTEKIDTPAPLVDAVNTSQPASRAAKPETLPQDLKGAKPRYAFGKKQFDLNFASDIDRAAYIAAQKNPSKRDADYVKHVSVATGWNDDQVREHGQRVRAAIKDMAWGAEPGVLNVPQIDRTPAAEEQRNSLPASADQQNASSAPVSEAPEAEKTNSAEKSIEGEYRHVNHPDVTAQVSKTERGYQVEWAPDDVQEFRGKNAAEKARAALEREQYAPANQKPIKVESRAAPEPASAENVPSQENSASMIDAAAHEAATSPHNDLPEPTPAMKEAGNYQMGHVRVHGLDISIENPRGSERTGKREDGSTWSHEMSDHYGYITGHGEGADGDHPDVYVGPNPESDKVFIVDQLNQKDGSFDEHKILLGYPNRAKAVSAYKSNFDKGWKVGPVTEMSIDQFKEWLKGDTTKPIAASKNIDTDRQNTEPDDSTNSKQVSSSEKIDDFGEVLHGARKHYAAAYADELAKAKEQDISAVPLSKSWPEPDYAKLIEAGAAPSVVGFVRAMRDEIPNKPQKSWKLKGWSEKAEALRSFADEILSGRITPATLNAQLEKHARLAGIVGRADLYARFGHDVSLKGITFERHHYSIYRGEENVDMWTIEKKASASAFSNWPSTLAHGKTREEALNNFRGVYSKLSGAEEKADKAIRFDIYSRIGKPGFFIGKKVGKNHLDLEHFEKVEDARKYLNENYDSLVKALNEKKAIPNERRETNAPRVGIDHRSGADVTPEQFTDAFGFRGVQFGNYVENARRQQDLNNTYDALMDLAGVINVPPRALSLNGTLGIAFGARGHGGKNAPSAHYEPGTLVINLTKANGAGSLAHELWHGLDNYFSRARNDNDNYLTERPYKRGDGVRPEMVEAFKRVADAIKASKMPSRARSLDDRRSKPYWATGRELSARAFETYIIAKLQDQGLSNDYLANIVSEDFWNAAEALGLEEGGTYPYPNAAEIPAIRAAFDEFFNTVETKETDSGIAMFSLRDNRNAAARENGPISKTDAHGVIAQFNAGRRLGDNGDIRLVDSFKDLPAAIQQAADEQGANPEDVEGVFHNGTVYLVRDRHANETELERTLFHEAYGHYGLRGLFGKAIFQKMNQLYAAIGGSKGLNEIASRHGINLQDYAAGMFGADPETRNAVMAEELLAHMAQDQRPTIMRAAKEVLGAIRAWLRQHGFAMLSKFKDSDIAYLLKRARQVVKTGSGMGEGTRFLFGENSPMFKRSDDTRAAYEKRIDELFAGAEPNNRSGVRVLDHSDVLDMLGYGDHEVVLAEKHAVSDGRFNHPQFTAADWKKVPDWLENPVAVFRRDDGNLTVIAPETKNGKPIIIGVVPEASQAGYAGGKKVQILLTAYDKDNGRLPIDRMIKDGQLRYIDQRKSPAFNDSSGHRLPSNVAELRGRGHKIYTGADLFKYRQSKTSIPADANRDRIAAARRQAGVGVDEETVSPEVTPPSDGAMFKRRSETSVNQSFEAPIERTADAILRVWQDKFRPLKMTQSAIEKHSGTEIPKNQNAYLAEEAFHGKTENDLRQLQENFIQPIAAEMAKKNIMRSELDLYLMAKHAPERNAAIAEINPKMPDGGSGMTNAQAAAVIAKAKAEGKQADLDSIAGKIYSMLQYKRDLLRESGLQSDDETDAWESKYKNYVPLKGFAENEISRDYPRTGKGFNIGGKESMRALGRESMSESPLLHAISDTTATIIRKRKNEVGRALLSLVEANPNPGYWSIHTDQPTTVRNAAGETRTYTQDTERRIVKTKDENGNTVETVKETAVPMAMLKDKYFSVKRGGKQYYIKINDDLLMKAMKNLGVEPMNVIVRHIGAATRVLSALSTSYSPEFMVSNSVKDVQEAVINVLAEQDLHDGKLKGKSIALKMVKDIPSSIRAIHASLWGKQLSGAGAEWQKSFDDFRDDGAKTGWYDAKDIDGVARELNTLIREAESGVVGTAFRAKNLINHVVERANTAIENGVRLSVYKNAVEAGVPRHKAASLAKNLTINFNRKGEIGATLNALFMFSNAAIQGTATFARSIATFKVDPVTGKKSLNLAQKTAIGITAAAFGLAMLNAGSAGDDDDGENYYDKLRRQKPYLFEKNVVLMKSMFGGAPGEYYSIPTPYGYGVFHVIGDNAAAMLRGAQGVGQTAVNIVKAIIGAFSPISVDGSHNIWKAIGKTLTPTLLSPIASLMANEDYKGAPIYKTNAKFGTPKPDSELSKRSTKEHWRAIAEWLNETTGGSKFRSGAIDVSPDTLSYLFDFLTGSAGAFYSRSVDAVVKAVQGKPLDDSEIPFLRRVSGKVSDSADVHDFYERKTQIDQLRQEFKSLHGEEKMAFRQKYGAELQLQGKAEVTQKALATLHKRRDIIAAKDIPEEDKQRRLDEIDAVIQRRVDQFNRSYNDKVKARAQTK